MDMMEVDDNKVGWLCQKQKLIAMIVLDDSVGNMLTDHANTPFFRGFVVEERNTGAISVRMRFRYRTGDKWYSLQPDLQPDFLSLSRVEKIAVLTESVEWSVLTALEMMVGGKVKPPKCIVKSFFPPDDGGDWKKTIDWLVAEDLIEVREERVDG